MNVNLKWATALLIACLVTSVGTWSLTNGSRFGHTQPELRANVFVLHEGIGGTEELCGANLITNLGEKYVRDSLGFGNATGTANVFANSTNVIAVGNYSAVAATDTDLNLETTLGGFARSNATSYAWYNTTGSNYAYNQTKTFTATAATIFNCTGLFWGYGASKMFAEAAITQTTFNIGDNCTNITPIYGVVVY